MSTPHDSSFTHVQGASSFIDDRHKQAREVFVGIITSEIACGRVLSFNREEILKLEGVLGVYDYRDIHHNRMGTIKADQPILAEDYVQYYSEPLYLIATENKTQFLRAKSLVKIQYEIHEAQLSLAEAITKKSFLTETKTISRGEAAKSIKEAPYKIKGSFHIEGQEHFYLESQAAIAYPLERGQIEVHSSSQHPTEVQHVVAEVIGVPFHHVVSIVKRMGGGFGGKESQAAPFAAMAALVAHKLGRPARLVLTKDEDMMITGKRHPFINFYHVGFDQKGKILGIEFDFYSDGGAYTDLSPSIMERAMLHADGAYYFPHVTIRGTVCKTNFHSNTAFRGFGGPQGTATIENIMEEIAQTLKLPAHQVRRVNLYDQMTITPYGQEITFNPLPQIFHELIKSSDYEKRLREIEAFNKKSKTLLRGISLTATKFGIAFTAKFLNQGNAQVNLHLDGTLQVSTGATEMGQGVNTKIAQIVSRVFSLPDHHVMVMPTSTEKNHNTSPTAASSGTDINGMAAYLAAMKIRRRLSQVAKHYFLDLKEEIHIDEQDDKTDALMSYQDGHILYQDKKVDLVTIIKRAYFHRVQLGDYAFFKTPGLSFDKEKGQGRAFNYFTNGMAVSEVLIDRFTGGCKVMRADILMDLGRPINHGIDAGQVTGAFIQAQGWVTAEKLMYSAEGKLLSHSPTTYKIPNMGDTPRIFKVDFIENNHEGHFNIFGSKAVGEPPFLLGISVWTAIKHALSFNQKNEIPKLRLPATHEEILLTLEKLS